MIPKLLHQIWVGEEPPSNVQDWHESWTVHHPEWKVLLWREADLAPIVEIPAFWFAKVPAVRADIARVEVLYRLGGVYVDADAECTWPLDGLIDGARRLVLSEGAHLTNSFVAVEPHDPFIAEVRQFLMSMTRADAGRADTDPVSWTGPLLWTRVFSQQGCARDPGTRILAPDYFLIPKSKNVEVLQLAAMRRFGTHHGLASWRTQVGFRDLIRRSRLRTRIRRFLDLGAP